MKKAKVTIQPSVKVELQSATEMLDEVLVVAYGTAKKSSFAGSAALVKASDIQDVPSTTFENALNGKVAGLQLTNNSGQAGSAPAIRIRGIGSMNADNEPLYVIDGVPSSTREKTIDRTFSKIVLPISQDEINANPAIASQQNPGY